MMVIGCTGNLRDGYKLCVGRAQLVEVSQNTSIDLQWSAQDQNL